MKRFLLILAALMALTGSCFAATPVTTPEISYTAAGGVPNFSFPFRVWEDADLVVTLDGVTQTLGSDYTVTGVGEASGGTVVFDTAPTATTAIEITRLTPIARDTDYTTGGPLRAATLNDDIDKVVTQVQDLDYRTNTKAGGVADQAARSLKFPLGDTTNSTLPDIATRASRALGFDVAGAPTPFGVSADLSGYAISTTPVADALAQYAADGALNGVNIVHRVATIEALRSVVGSTGRTAVQIMGYYAANDGGGGPVRSWDGASTCTDDGGSCIDPDPIDANPGRWVFTGPELTNPLWFGAKADGSTDDTAKVVNANTYSTDLKFPAGKTMVLLNWEPLASTSINADGATVLYTTHTLFSTTNSSGAVIISNDNITVRGGHWTASITDTWSASFILNGGDNFVIEGAEISDSWGGISGHDVQNGSLQSQGLTIRGCYFHDNSHNTYLADIDGLLFTGNISENSDRDGLRTFRNIQNIIITDNILRNNGNDDAAQSRDGIDLFIEGTRTIVTGNHISGNKVNGIDIKRNDSEPVVTGDKEFIIANNFIFDNDFMGVSIQDNTAAQLGIDNAVVAHNHIYGNGSYGVYLLNNNNPILSENYLYNNQSVGARIEDCDDINITGNFVKNNGLNNTSGSRVGLNIIDSPGGIVTGNVVRFGGNYQFEGINAGGSDGLKIINNDVSGHPVANFVLDTTILGHSVTFPVVNDTALHLLKVMDRNIYIVSAGLLVNNTITSMDVLLGKRNLTSGTYSGAVATVTGFANATAYNFKDLGTLSATEKDIAGDEVLTYQLSNITSGFTEGLLAVSYCD